MSEQPKTPSPPPARPRGRPVGSTRVSEPRAQAAVWLPVSLYNRIDRLSVRQQQSMSATIRQLLILKL